MKTCLGIELGSTRIKAVTVGGGFQPVSSGDYTWASCYKSGVWTYPLEEVWKGLKQPFPRWKTGRILPPWVCPP